MPRSPLVAAVRNPFAGRQAARKGRFDQPPAGGNSVSPLGQRPDRVEMIRQHNDCIDGERMPQARFAKCAAQPVDMLREQPQPRSARLTVKKKLHRPRSCGARRSCRDVLWRCDDAMDTAVFFVGPEAGAVGFPRHAMGIAALHPSYGLRPCALKLSCQAPVRRAPPNRSPESDRPACPAAPRAAASPRRSSAP